MFKYHYISPIEPISKIFYIKRSHNLRYKTCLKEFSFCHLDHASVVGLWGRGTGGQKLERGDLRWRRIDCAFNFYF